MIRRGHAGADTRLLHRIASVLLRYPDQRILSLPDDVAAALPSIRHRTDRERLARDDPFAAGVPLSAGLTLDPSLPPGRRMGGNRPGSRV